MLSSSPPAVLPLICGLPPLCGHPHPPSARTRCTPAALPVTLMDMAWSFQSSLYQETACSLQGWEHTEQASSVCLSPLLHGTALPILPAMPLEALKGHEWNRRWFLLDIERKQGKRASRPRIAFPCHQQRLLYLSLYSESPLSSSFSPLSIKSPKASSEEPAERNAPGLIIIPLPCWWKSRACCCF